MKYLVLSDSHGNVDNMVRAVEREKPDGIIHLGDCWRDAEELHELFPRLPLEQVPGNCDFGRFEELVDASARPMLLNPGSIGDVRRPTYGVLECKDGKIIPSVFKLEQV